MHSRLLKPVLLSAIAWLLSSCGSQDLPDTVLAPDPATRILTKEGAVTGGIASNGTYIWLGIPYAKPPVGDLRWRAPLPPVPRRGSLQATEFGSACAQLATPLGSPPDSIETGSFWGSEDCLHLNIYAPADRTKALPVMLWVHGGGNFVGHSSFYDGSILANRYNLMVVTINYRLGPFGWWHHPAFKGDSPEDASGNYGTLDIIRALEWVQANITAFGGDANRVTVFGESAGGTNVAALSASPLARGLFHGGIMQSGDTTRGVTPASASHKMDDAIPGSETSTAETILRALMSQDCDRACAKGTAGRMTVAEKAALMRGLDAQAVLNLYGLAGLSSMPRIIKDGHVLPREGLLAGFRTSSVPMILGTNKDEPKLFMAFDPNQTVMLGGLPLWRRDAHMYELVAHYGSAAWKLRGVDEVASLLHEVGVPTWTYRFDWDDLAGLPFLPVRELFGAAHAFEIPFVFGHFQLGRQTALLFDEDNKAERLALSERMMAYWAAFAYHGDPGRGLDNDGPLWPAFSPGKGVGFLHLDAGEGGIRLSKDPNPLTLGNLIAMISKDERIEGAVQRCEVAKATFAYNMTKPVYSEIKKQLNCF